LYNLFLQLADTLSVLLVSLLPKLSDALDKFGGIQFIGGRHDDEEHVGPRYHPTTRGGDNGKKILEGLQS
jgi:hypothetical protein